MKLKVTRPPAKAAANKWWSDLDCTFTPCVGSSACPA